MPEADPAIRAAIAADAAHARLGGACTRNSPRSIRKRRARIHATDAQRIQRALEVYRASGRPISDWQRERGHHRLPLRVLKLAVSPRDRGVLHARIERRFDAMLAAGFLDEVRRLRSLPQLQSHPAPLGPAGPARSRLSPGLGTSGRADDDRRIPRPCDLRHPPAGQAPVDLAAWRTGCAVVRSRPSTAWMTGSRPSELFLP